MLLSHRYQDLCKSQLPWLRPSSFQSQAAFSPDSAAIPEKNLDRSLGLTHPFLLIAVSVHVNRSCCKIRKSVYDWLYKAFHTTCLKHADIKCHELRAGGVSSWTSYASHFTQTA